MSAINEQSHRAFQEAIQDLKCHPRVCVGAMLAVRPTDASFSPVGAPYADVTADDRLPLQPPGSVGGREAGWDCGVLVERVGRLWSDAN
jgi:hypothetical protein